MAKQTINVGATANDKKGDSLRAAFQKVNQNFTELYVALGLDTGASLNLGNFKFTNNTMTLIDPATDGSTLSTVVINQPVSIGSNLTVGGDLIPAVANGGDLGSSSQPWRSLYVSDSTIYLGNHTLSINDQGELTYNGNRVAHEAGEFMTLDNLSNVNSSNPSNGDVLTWAGSFWTHATLASIGNLRVNSSAGGTTIGTVDNPNTGGWGGYDLYIDSGNNSDAKIYIPSVSSQASNMPLQILNNALATSIIQLFGRGGVQVITNNGVNEKVFEFADNGTLIFPDGSLALTDSVLDNGLDADIKGSVFGDDSSVIVNAIDRTLHSVSVNTLQLNFSISGDNIVAPTGGYITIGHSDGAGGVDNVATFDGNGIIFAQDVNMGVGKKIQSASGDELQLVSATNMGDYTWTFNASGALLFPSIPAGDHYEQIVIGGAEILAQDSLLLLNSFNDLVRIVANAQGPAKNWTFDTAGDLTLPGNLKSNGNINIEINLADSTKRIWQFGEDGELTFPDGTSQSTAATAGMTASSSATLTNKTFDVSVGSNNIFSIQGNQISSYTGSGSIVVLSQSPTISVLNISDSQINLDGGSGIYYWGGQSGVAQAGDLKAGVYASDPSSNNSLFTFGTNGSNKMSVGVEGSLFVGTAMPANNGGLNSSYAGWLVVQAGAKFGGDLNTLGNFILDTPGNYVRFGDGTTQTTAADFGYLDLDKDTIKGTAGYQYTFATDGYFTSSTSSESLSYFFVTYNTTNANIAAGWTVVGGTANTTVSSVTYPVAGYPGVIQVNLTQPAASTAGFYPVTVTSPDRLRVEIQPNPGTSDKFTFANDGTLITPATGTVRPLESTSTAGNPLTVRAGDSETQVGGNLILRGGDTIGNVGTPRNSGYAVLRAGSTVTGNGGYAELLGGNTTAGDGGQAYVTAGSATTGNGGPVEIRAGTTVTGDGGSVTIESGEAVTGTAGNIDITAKGTVTGDGGNVNLTGGSATSGNGGAINLTAGDTIGSGDPGTIRLRTFNAAAPQDWTFNFNGTLTFPDATVQTTAFTTNPTLNVLKIEDGVHEKFQAKADATGVVAHDCASGHVFYHTSPDANWTVNLTNLNLSSGYATAVTLVIVQGGTGYYPSAVQIGGVGQTLNWQGNATPTPSTNRTDVVTFSIINNSGTYTVLGQLTGF